MKDPAPIKRKRTLDDEEENDKWMQQWIVSTSNKNIYGTASQSYEIINNFQLNSIHFID